MTDPQNSEDLGHLQNKAKRLQLCILLIGGNVTTLLATAYLLIGYPGRMPVLLAGLTLLLADLLLIQRLRRTQPIAMPPAYIFRLLGLALALPWAVLPPLRWWKSLVVVFAALLFLASLYRPRAAHARK